MAVDPARLPRLDRPVFIIAAPRSGSTLLFEQICKHPDVWSIGKESHGIFDRVLHHAFDNPDFDSVRATAGDASQLKADRLAQGLASQLVGCDGRRYLDLPEEFQPRSVRFVDKLPKNSLRVPFIDGCFPEARFIFLYREPKGNISSMMEAWREGNRSGRFVTYRKLRGTSFENWCLILPPGWRDMVERSTAEIAAFQWRQANSIALADLLNIPRQRWHFVTYADLCDRPADTLRGVCRFMEIPYDDAIFPLRDGKLAHSKTTLSAPEADKWRRNEADILSVLPGVEEVVGRINTEMEFRRGSTPP